MPRRVLAQESKTLRRIGFLAARSRSTPASPDVHYDAFVTGMRSLGYIEGKNLVIEWRFADGKYDRLPTLAQELVKARVEVIVTHGTATLRAAQRASTTIPIVCAVIGGNPIADGFVKSLARPQTNITGLANNSTEIPQKYIQLLKTLLPNETRVAVLVHPANPTTREILEGVKTKGQQNGITASGFEATTAQQLDANFARMSAEHIGAAIVANDSFFLGESLRIANAALKNHVAVISPYWEHAASGALASYGPNLVDYYRRASVYVDKILKGAKPNDLPIEMPTEYELVINRKTAKALGLTLSNEVLIRADRVID